MAHLQPRVQQEVCAVGLINGFALVADWPEDRELPKQTYCGKSSTDVANRGFLVRVRA